MRLQKLVTSKNAAHQLLKLRHTLIVGLQLQKKIHPWINHKVHWELPKFEMLAYKNAVNWNKEGVNCIVHLYGNVDMRLDINGVMLLIACSAWRIERIVRFCYPQPTLLCYVRVHPHIPMCLFLLMPLCTPLYVSCTMCFFSFCSLEVIKEEGRWFLFFDIEWEDSMPS